MADRSAKRPGAQGVYAHWSSTKNEAWFKTEGKDGFSPASNPIYQSVWRSWLDWLSKRQGLCDDGLWLSASSEDVQAFIDGPAPKGTTRRPKSPDELAKFSKQRYWRVLRDVYGHAISMGLLAANPALGLVATPSVDNRSRSRALLPPPVLAMLRDRRRLSTLVPPGRLDWVTARDRALITMLAHCGPTVTELCSLKGGDLRLEPSGSGPQQLEVPGLPRRDSPMLDVAGRAIPLPPSAATTLREWLAVRAELMRQDAARPTGPSRRRLTASPAEAPLFFSAKRGPDRARVTLMPAHVFTVTRNCIRPIYRDLGFSGSHIAAGPEIVRNSVIADWERRHDRGTAAMLAGLKELPQAGH